MRNRRTLLVLALATLMVTALGAWGSGAFAAIPSGAGVSTASQVQDVTSNLPQPFDCSKIEELGIDKRMSQEEDHARVRAHQAR
jgi:hypothetical protein